ncbi:MAG: class I SAM-dependent methyltransferase [Peptococcia bacterium]|jgi:predicted methyltransferase
MNKFLKATGFTHYLLSKFLSKGQKVIDATAGNGQDTLFLARTVGPLGLVYAFDIQENALQETKKILEKNNCLQQVKLIHAGHEKINKFVQEPVQAIIYNLGYLPGGNKEIITKGETTLLSLQQGMELLNSGGVVSLIIYPGHSGGEKEATIIEKYVTSLSSRTWQVMKWGRVNVDIAKAPYVLFIYKN